ncbi:tetratricopeptide repeat protein [candidate division KSB1 bacterium]|nr:tetratricopeptide repeat protein [candidate division KSB1 bacterium]
MRKSINNLLIGTAGIIVILLAVFSFLRPRTLSSDKILAKYRQVDNCSPIEIRYPYDETIFPPEIIPPKFEWFDTNERADSWLISIDFQDGEKGVTFLSDKKEWTPPEEQWSKIKHRSTEKKAKITIWGFEREGANNFLSKAKISISTSKDSVGAPIFYREVNLPFSEAVKDPSRIRWRFGEISSSEQPPIVLEKLPVCGNCHSFSSNGSLLGMDVDYANDKGSYTIVPTAQEMVLEKENIITWSDYKKEDNELTFGLLSQISPDGKYVVSTVKDRSVFVAVPNLEFSQLFFPVKGILVVYFLESGEFHALPGADDKKYVQSNPSWSPDGKTIVFARSRAITLKSIREKGDVLLTIDECREFINRDSLFIYDLYRIPFNDGIGGTPEPLQGASNDGYSNYFAKYSPDGKWIVFCKAKSFMLLQKDSELYIMPAEGGEAKRLSCNTSLMNSWHSWSPNSKWLVFSSKVNSPYTQLFLTHIDEEGNSSPPVLLSQFTAADRAANIPEFVNIKSNGLRKIDENFIDDFSYLRVAMQYMKTDDYENAEIACQKALKINPDNIEAQLQIARIFARQDRLNEAVAHSREAIRIDGQSSEAHAQLGNLLWASGQRKEGMKHLNEAVSLDPENSDSHIKLGQALFDQGKNDEALEHLNKAASLTSNAKTHGTIANVLIKNGQIDPGIAHYRKALEFEPDDMHILNNLAMILLRQNKPEQAAAYYHRALKNNPNALPSINGLAILLLNTNDPTHRNLEEAIQLATKGCELTHYQEPESLVLLADAYAKAGNFKEAIVNANAALRLANSRGITRLAVIIKKRIELYQMNKNVPESN